MGLSLKLEDDVIAFTFSGFTEFRAEVVSSIYGQEMGDIIEKAYKTFYKSGTEPLTTEEKEKLEQVHPDLWILLNHCDESGEITPDESNKLYNVLKDVEFKFLWDTLRFNQLKDMLKKSVDTGKMIEFIAK